MDETRKLLAATGFHKRLAAFARELDSYFTEAAHLGFSRDTAKALLDSETEAARGTTTSPTETIQRARQKMLRGQLCQ